MRCIICEKEEKESTEHIIPKALGNKKLITNRVCKRCNNCLGTNVDSYLTDHPLVKIIRINNNLTGKKGNKIKLFNGIETDIHTGTKYSINDGNLKIVPQIIFNKEGKIRIEAASVEEGNTFIKKVLKRNGYGKEEIESHFEQAHCMEVNRKTPEFIKDASINITLMDLAAIKIAYEYAHFIIGDCYLKDEVAVLFRNELKKAIMSEKHDVYPSDKLPSYVVFPISGSGIDNMLAEQRNEFSKSGMNVLHTIFFIEQDNSLYCILNLCMTDVISFAIKITEKANLYKIRKPMSIVFKNGDVLTL